MTKTLLAQKPKQKLRKTHQAPVEKTTIPQNKYWRKCEVEKLFNMNFMDLIFKAAEVHRQNFDANKIQLSTLLSIKTGGCSEDCSYCPQSRRYNTGVKSEELMQLEDIIAKAKIAKDRGATRFCMGAAWRGPKEKDIQKLTLIISSVKELGLETCGTFGMLKEGMADTLKESGLDYYNHNLDTNVENYANIIKTHTHQNRMETLGEVRKAGLKLCCGGIVGMNETRAQRAGLIASLANLDPPPESVPINKLVKVAGTPLENAEDLDWSEFIRTIAVARICMPKTFVRLSAGRSSLSEEGQALAFLAGANSIFYGDKLLVTKNPEEDSDELLLKKLDLNL